MAITGDYDWRDAPKDVCAPNDTNEWFKPWDGKLLSKNATNSIEGVIIIPIKNFTESTESPVKQVSPEKDFDFSNLDLGE
jgi:hypothetical protein